MSIVDFLLFRRPRWCRVLAPKMTTAALALLAVITASNAFAQDVLKLAVGQRGNWDTSVAEIGQRIGIFKKHGLNLDLLYTQGGGETQQAVISGSVDIGVATGIMGVLSAYSKGAPVRIIGAETTGAADLYWYVRADSPIHSLKDTAGKTIAYSTNGSSTNGIVTALIKQESLSARPVATGGPPSTLTMVMSGQIDVGWAAPPFGLDQLDQKQIKIIAKGNDAKVFRGQTVRVLIANLRSLQTKKALLDRFMTAYRETLQAMYSSNASALKSYAEWLGISEDKARRVRDEFFPQKALDPSKIVGLDTIVQDAVALKYTSAVLTNSQLADLVQISAPTK